MLNKFIYRLFVGSSLFFLSINAPVYAAQEVEPLTPAMLEVAEKVNVNKATSEQLAMLSGIGEKKALAIIEYREMNGDFVAISELLKVKGIGESILKKIEPFVTL